MTRHRPLAILVLSLLAGCTAQGPVPQSGTGPAQSTGLPFEVNGRELETPNSLPSGFTTVDPMAPATGVVGVSHPAP